MKFYGAIGYASAATETSPGVWTNNVTERPYFGDVVRNVRKLQGEEKVNADISVTNSISIVADAHANENFHAIRYIRWMGSLWTVDSVEVQAPRLLLRLGGVYNGPTDPTPVSP